jgi:hypothetical protein
MEGETLGESEAEGDKLGDWDGERLGLLEGDKLGDTDGDPDGLKLAEGDRLGELEGERLDPPPSAGLRAITHPPQFHEAPRNQ